MPDANQRGPYKPGQIRARSRSRILQAAEQEFASHGYKGARIQAIADAAQVPKANIHYYFGNKLALYGAVLEGTLELWDEALNALTPAHDPATALSGFIDLKMTLSRTQPVASRLYAKEMLSGAPHLSAYLQADYKAWFDGRAGVIQSWIDQGKMAPLDPAHLIFLIWASTQHYADFAPQVEASLGIETLQQTHFDAAAASLKQMVLRACGLS